MSLLKIKRTVPYRIAINFWNAVKRLFPLKSAAEKEYDWENRRDKRQNRYANSTVDLVIKEFKKQKGVFGGFSLAESSVRCFLYNLLAMEQSRYRICEFGGGQSTLFLNVLTRYVDITVTTFEHDPEWAAYLKEKISSTKIEVVSCELMQVNDESRNKMFDNPLLSKDTWIHSCSKIAQKENKNPVMRNGFYNIPDNQFPDKNLDAIILDGPHGNGRSLCFPLFYRYLDQGTLILLDDYHHYPFLEDLGRLFRYEVLEERRYTKSNKGWVVLRIITKLEHEGD